MQSSRKICNRFGSLCVVVVVALQLYSEEQYLLLMSLVQLSNAHKHTININSNVVIEEVVVWVTTPLRCCSSSNMCGCWNKNLVVIE